MTKIRSLLSLVFGFLLAKHTQLESQFDSNVMEILQILSRKFPDLMTSKNCDICDKCHNPFLHGNTILAIGNWGDISHLSSLMLPSMHGLIESHRVVEVPSGIMVG